MARKLRIAVSVFFGVLTVVLCVLWVRSYWVSDVCYFSRNGVSSNYGQFYFNRLPPDFSGSSIYESSPSEKLYLSRVVEANNLRPIIGIAVMDRGLTDPFWSLALTTSLIAAVPWVSWRFSLRTLLIATTLVAVGMGLAMWLTP